jgi:hypothetical protein
MELLHRLVHPGDVAEGDLGRVGRHAFGPRLAEGVQLRASALNLADEQEPETDEEHKRQQVRQQ